MNKTVYIIGAGASAEVRMPTGEELKQKIGDLLNIDYDHYQISGDRIIGEVLEEQFEGDAEGYRQITGHIRDALPQAISIDNFIDSQRENDRYDKVVMCSKLAIVRAILMAERESFLSTELDRKLDFKALGNTWYGKFFKLITENCTPSELEERCKSLVLIIYNYDRCVEQFLFYALQNYYQIDGSKAASLIKYINIYHPYGSVGDLPFYGSDIDETMEFGKDLNSDQLFKLSKQIKTFAEGVDPSSSEISTIKDHMTAANKLVFLGFAFHKLNMEILECKGRHGDVRKTTYATALGFSENNIAETKKQIEELYGNKIITLPGKHIRSLQCGPFFDEYSKGLSF